MSNVIVAAVQQQTKIFEAPLDYQVDIFKFLEQAQAKKAQLVVFPALTPLMLVPPLISESALRRLKKRTESQEYSGGLVGKLLEKAIAAAGQVVGGFRSELLSLLKDYPDEIYEAYIDLFSAAALKYRMTIVAGSFYLREHVDSNSAHIAYVFGPNGMILGRQEKVHLTPNEMKFCHAGTGFQPIETPVGRVGILIGEDVLYPESSRILAYQGAEILISLTASSSVAASNQTRAAFMARVDENELFGLQSALTGENLLQPSGPALVGKSGVFQPFQLSANGDGLIAEAARPDGEALTIGRINLEILKDYWIRLKPRLRQTIQPAAYQALVNAYSSRKTLDQLYWNPSADLFDTDLLDEAGPSALPDAVLSQDDEDLFSPFADDAD